MSEYKAFGEMTKPEKMALFEAWLDGGQIEFDNGAGMGWALCDHPEWRRACYYRIAPTEPSIDWSHVHPDYAWLAESAPGRGLLFKGKPSLSPTGFGLAWCGTASVSARIFTSYKPGTCKPEDSLVKRPEGV